MLNFIIDAFFLASVSWFYHIILKDYILERWFQFGYEKFGKFEGTWKEHLYMPIWGCQYCTSGQLALWYGIFFSVTYSLIAHIAFIILTVLITKIIWKTLEQ